MDEGTEAAAAPLTPAEMRRSAESIAEVQCRDGMIPWFGGGHCDPWNHVEAAMALATVGMFEEATKAYEWLVSSQLPDGSWFNYYLAGSGVKDPRIDTNVCAYMATGTWHQYLATGDIGFLEWMWKVLDRAMEFVLRYQRESGNITWSLDPDGRRGRYALLTGSCSIYHALGCAQMCASVLGYERPMWAAARRRLRTALSTPSRGFEPKDEFAMDWYYPVLSGALVGRRAGERLDSRWDRFVMEGRGVRCVSTSPWVTAAETAECAIALDISGRREQAGDLLAWSRDLRLPDGSYWTGLVYPERMPFPGGERTTYTAAAVILAVDAHIGRSRTSKLFGRRPQG